MPKPPAGLRRRRGRPPRQSRLASVPQSDRKPNGAWIDSDVLARRVHAVVGDRDERIDKAEIVPRLFRLARRLLGRELAEAECVELRALVHGGKRHAQSILRTLGTADSDDLRPAPASVITRVLMAWRHGLGERDVQKLKYGGKPVAGVSTALVLKYEAEQPIFDKNRKPKMDKDGRPILARPPVCDEKGQPILWVPDEHGQPSRPHVSGEQVQPRPVSIARPPVKKLIYR